jgi:hypothetical protein
MSALLPLLPPGYTHDPQRGRYRDERGRFVAYKTIYRLMGALEQGSGDTLQKLGVALSQEAIPASAWYLASARQLQRLHVQFAALGAGGVNSLTARDYAAIDRSIRGELQRLLTFGIAITGKTLSEAQIGARVDMYIGTARKQYWARLSKPRAKESEVVIERRRLGNADHCDWCLYLAKAGWQPVDTVPIPGESNDTWDAGQCLSACHCEIETRVIARTEAASILGERLPSHYQRRE